MREILAVGQVSSELGFVELYLDLVLTLGFIFVFRT